MIDDSADKTLPETTQIADELDRRVTTLLAELIGPA